MWDFALSTVLPRDNRTRLSIFFRALYRALYFLLHLLLLALLLVTPGDLITQAVQNGNLYSMLIISIGYVATILVVLFVYLTRLYLNRSALSSIPKPWIPVEKGEVGKRVHTMIQRYLSRSAAIAYDARPRIISAALPGSLDNQQEEGQDQQGGKRTSFHMLRMKKTATLEEEMGISLPPHHPVWGEIEHPGWASPNSPDLPNLQYNTVIFELPNLIEAKALTLAPPDPRSGTNPPMLDAHAVELLQRLPNAGLREYLAHLTELGVLTPSSATSAFVTMYEHARFSPRPVPMIRFRELMHNFAEVLRGMDPMDQAVFDPEDEDEAPADADDNNSSSDIDNDAPLGTNPTTPRSHLSRRSGDRDASPASSGKSSSSQVQKGKRPALPGRNSSANTWQAYRTAPTTPKSRRTAVSHSSPSSSVDTFAQTRRPYPVSQPSSASLRSAATGKSGLSGASGASYGSGASGGSVIRLADRRDATDLPYVLLHANTR